MLVRPDFQLHHPVHLGHAAVRRAALCVQGALQGAAAAAAAAATAAATAAAAAEEAFTVRVLRGGVQRRGGLSRLFLLRHRSHRAMQPAANAQLFMFR